MPAWLARILTALFPFFMTTPDIPQEKPIDTVYTGFVETDTQGNTYTIVAYDESNQGLFSEDDIAFIQLKEEIEELNKKVSKLERLLDIK